MKKRKVAVRSSWSVGSRFKWFAITGLVSLVTVACLLFVLENQQLVIVSFLGFSSPQLQVSIVGVVAFLVGMIAGVLMAAAYALSARWRGRRVSH